MAKLNTAARRAVPKSRFGVPSKAPGSGSYPMPDRKHAAIAKGYAARYATPTERAMVDRKANRILRSDDAMAVARKSIKSVTGR